MNAESHCRCPGCGTCNASAQRDKLKVKVAALEAENASLRAMFKFDNEGGHGWWTATFPSDNYDRDAAINAALKETP